MPTDILTIFETSATVTISLGGLPSSALGVGQGSAAISNSGNFPAVLLSAQIEAGTSPTAGASVEFYLLRDDDDAGTAIATDNWSGTDTGLTIVNAQLLGTLVFSVSTTGIVYRGDFDTAPLGPLGETWGIGVVNASGANLDAADASHIIHYKYYRPQIQN